MKNHPWLHLLNFLTFLKDDKMFSQALASFLLWYLAQKRFLFSFLILLVCFPLVLLYSIHRFPFTLFFTFGFFLYTFFANMSFNQLLELAIFHGTKNFLKFLKPRSKLFFFLESFNSWVSLDSQSCFLANTTTLFQFRSCLWNIISKLFVSYFKFLF